MSSPPPIIEQPPAVAPQTDASSIQPAPHTRSRGLLIIAILKLLKALLFIAIGVGALRLLHKDVVDVLTQLAWDIRFDTENQFINLILDKAALINDQRLRQISIGVFAYAALDILEGVGLMLNKPWGEYLTLIITASFLPWEFFELFHHITWFRIGIILLNAIIVLYLLWFVRWRHRGPRKATA